MNVQADPGYRADMLRLVLSHHRLFRPMHTASYFVDGVEVKYQSCAPITDRTRCNPAGRPVHQHGRDVSVRV